MRSSASVRGQRVTFDSWFAEVSAESDNLVSLDEGNEWRCHIANSCSAIGFVARASPVRYCSVSMPPLGVRPSKRVALWRPILQFRVVCRPIASDGSLVTRAYSLVAWSSGCFDF